MENMGKTETAKKPGTNLMTLGLIFGLTGAVLVFLSVSTGNMGAPLSWGLVGLGAVVAIIGFARRMLAAVESR